MKILPRICSLGLLLALTAFGAGQTNAQTPNMGCYVKLTVKKGATIKLNLKAEAENTPIKIVSGEKTYNGLKVGKAWTQPTDYISGDTYMTVYGDVTGFAIEPGNDPKNKVTGLDPSHNTKLLVLNCKENKITSLDVSKNTELKYLTCNNNQLTTLDLSQNKKLEKLHCEKNHLSHVDLTANTALIEYTTSDNVRPVVFPFELSRLPGFDVVKMSELTGGTLSTEGVFNLAEGSKTISYRYAMNADKKETFKLSGPTVNAERYITLTVKSGVDIKLDLKADAANTGIKIVSGTKTYDVAVGTDWTGSKKYLSDGSTMKVYGDLSGFNCGGNTENVTALDPSYNTELKELWCYNNPLTTLDVSKNTKLTYLVCSNTQLATLDVSKNTALEYLKCGSNELTSLDVSKNTALTSLDCFGNHLTSLDVSNNTALTRLECENNQFITLDVSENTKLDTLVCSKNQLTTLDVSKNTELTRLECENNKLATLDVNMNTALTELKCGNNQLTTLDVSKNTALDDLECQSNLLSHLDPTADTALTFLSCSSNQLTSLDVSKNTKLEGLECDGNQLTSLDVSKNTALEYLICNNNLLTSLDVSQNTALSVLDCKENQLSHLDLTANTVLEGLNLNDNVRPVVFPCDVSSLPGFDVNKVLDIDGGTLTDGVFTTDAGSEFITYLYQVMAEGINANAPDGIVVEFYLTGPTVNKDRYITLTVKDGQDIKLDLQAEAANTGIKIVSGTKTYDVTVGTDWTEFQNYQSDGTTMTVYGNLNGFDCSENAEKVTAIDVSQNTALTELYCFNNKLTSLDVTKNTELEYLYCSFNKLTSLDVSKNTALKDLRCDKNLLTTLDVGEITVLEYLYCDSNQFSSLDVSKNTKLLELSCGDNRLTTLDLSKNTALTELYCEKNQLSHLDLTANTALKKLNCKENQLSHLDLTANTALNADKVSASGNVHEIPNNLFPIADLPAGFDKGKCTEIKGGEFTADGKVNITAESGIMSYKYEMASGKSETFSLSLPKVTISFNANGGTGTMDPVKWLKGSEYTLPACTFIAPENMEFAGWDKGAVGTKIIVNEDVTLIAQWKAILVTVTFAPNGGTGTMDPVKVNKGSDYTLPACTFTAPAGKEFDKWDKGEVGKKITVNENITITAQWKEKVVEMVTITFNPGDGTGTMDPVQVEKGSEYTLPACTFTAPENMEFAGWDKGAVGAKIIVNEDITITAQWKEKVPEMVTITFDANGGTGTMDPVKVEKGSDYTLPGCGFIPPEGKVFAKWDKGKAGVTINVTKDLTIKAMWEKRDEKKALISFAPGEGSGTMASVQVAKNSKYTLPSCTFVAPMFKEFDRWDAGQVGESIQVTGDTTITALWKEQSTAVDVDHSAQLTVYPNPASNLLNIKGVDMKSVSLYDMLGRLVTFRPADSATSTVLNVNSYQTGVYLVRIELNNGHFVTRKIFINK